MEALLMALGVHAAKQDYEAFGNYVEYNSVPISVPIRITCTCSYRFEVVKTMFDFQKIRARVS